MAYISPWLTHFVGRQQPTDAARCGLLIKILREGTLGQWARHGSVLVDPGSMTISGTGSLCRDEFVSFRPVCFCDIPDDELQRHTTVYGRFGLAFKKEFLVAQGANPVFYLAKNSVACYERPPVPPLTIEDVEADPRGALLKHFAAEAVPPKPVRRCELFDRLATGLGRVLPPPWPPGTPGDAEDPIREIQMDLYMDLVGHVFAFAKLFDESLPEEHPDNYYMEREWRVAGFVSFAIQDVQCVYVAQGFRDQVESEFPRISVTELKFPTATPLASQADRVGK